MLTNFTKKSFFFFLFSLLFLNVESQTPFTDVTVATGITNPLNNILPLKHDGASVMDEFFLGSGAAWFDYNEDGYLDLYITMRDGANFLYRNDGPDGNGDYHFTDVAALLGIQDASGDGSGVVIADYDNDGFKDIYICSGLVDRLYKNNGGTSFTDVTASAGLSTTDDSRTPSASWGDYNNDGYLDLYITRYRPRFSANSLTWLDQLYLNDGDGTFTDVSDLILETNRDGYGFIGGWSDYDNDGDVDIILINDCFNVEGKSRIFRNDGGNDPVNDWIFTEVSAAVGVDDCSNGMGLAVGDINHDGWMDFANSDIGPINLWLNDGDGTFTDIASSAGVDGQSAAYYTWGLSFIDYNLDTWMDLFICAGALSIPGPPPAAQSNFFFENDGDETFTDISTAVDMDDDNVSRNAVFGDYDNDGDPDILLINYDDNVMLKQNNTNNGNSWFQIKLLDLTGNRDGIGARIKITTPDAVDQYYEVRSGSNLGGGDDITAYFGLGTNTTVSSIEVTWPGETSAGDTWSNKAANQVFVAQKGQGEGPLPIELLSFKATGKEKHVLLEWETANETDNKFFNLQKSSNGRDFENIGIIEGKGISTTNNFYAFVDENPFNGDNYYRLEQVDFDGTSSLSQIEQVRFKKEEFKILVTPNPIVSGSFEIQINHAQENVQVEIYNLVGQVVYSKRMASDDELTTMIIDTKGWSKGIYFVKINDGINHQTEKVILQQ
jgi:ASPIC/UnbV protein/type IX secretion system substrate protein/VCBS repeat protein